MKYWSIPNLRKCSTRTIWVLKSFLEQLITGEYNKVSLWWNEARIEERIESMSAVGLPIARALKYGRLYDLAATKCAFNG